MADKDNNTQQTENTAAQLTNAAIIIKAFNDACKSSEKIDKKKVKAAVKNILDIKTYLEDFIRFSGNISQIITNGAAKLDKEIVESQTAVIKIMTDSIGLFKTISEFEFPNMLKYKYALWRFKRRFFMLIDVFFGSEDGIAGYLKKIDDGGIIKVVDKSGKKIQKQISNIATLKDQIKVFSDVVESFNEMVGEIVNTSKNTFKNIAKVKAGFKLIESMLDQYSNIRMSAEVIKTMIVAINDMNKDDNGDTIVLRDRTKFFTHIKSSLEQLNDLIKLISKFNIGALIMTTIAKMTIKKIISNVKVVISNIAEFAEYVKQINISDVSEPIENVKKIVASMLGLVGGIVLLAAASIVLMVATPIALLSTLILAFFIKTVIAEFRWIAGKRKFTQLVQSTKNISLMISIIIGTMLIAAAGIVLLAIIGVKMLTMLKPALLTFAIVSVVLLAAAGLAYLISMIFKSGVGTVIYEGLLAILAIMGTMLIISGALILLAMIGQYLVEDRAWLYALGTIAGIALLMLAIAGLGVLFMIPWVMAAIMATTTAVLLTTISVTAILLVAAELILLSKINFDEQMVATIKANVKLVIHTALDVMNMIFEDVDDPTQGKKNSPFANLFTTIFKGAALIIKAAVSSVVLVLTFISVTIIIIITLGLYVLAKIKIDKDAVKESVYNIMSSAEYCIDAVFGDYEEKQQKQSGKEKFKDVIGKILTGFGDILTLIFGIVKLALIVVAVVLIIIVALLLKLVAKIKVDKETVKESVYNIMSTAEYCINAIFGDYEEPKQKQSGKEKFGAVVGKMLSGLGDVLVIVMGVLKLSAILAAVAFIILIGSVLKMVERISIDKETIKSNVIDIMSTAEYCINAIFGEYKDKKEKQSKFGKFIGSIGKAISGVGNILALVMGIIKVSLALLAVGLILVIGAVVKLITKVKVDKDEVINNVKNIMMATEYCIDTIFGNYKEKEQKQSKYDKFGGFVKRILAGYASGISLLMSIAKVALLAVSVTLILFVGILLKQIVKTAKDQDQATIKESVNLILGCGQYCIESVFEKPENPETDDSQSKFTKFVSQIFGELCDNIHTIMAVGKLALTLVAVAIISFMAKTLKKIVEIASELDAESIRRSLEIILGAAGYVQDEVFKPSEKQPAKDDSLKSKFTSFVGRVFNKIGDAIDVVMSVGRLAMTMAAVAMIVFLAEKLKIIHDTTKDFDGIRLQQDTIMILNTADMVAKTVNENKGLKDIDDKIIKNITNVGEILNILLTIVEKYKDINTETVDTIVYALQQIIPAVSDIDINVDNTLLQDLCNNIQLFIKTISTDFAQTQEGIDLIVYAINTIIPVVNSIKIDIDLTQLAQLNNLSESLSLFVDTFKIDSTNFQNNSTIIIDTIDKLNSRSIEPDIISGIDSLATVIDKLFEAFNKNSKNAERGIDKSIQFLNKVNDVKLENLQTTARLFEKMADFSASINGNFDGLADALNEKIAPLIEKLNDALEETKTAMEQSEAAINRANAAAANVQAAIANTESVAGDKGKSNDSNKGKDSEGDKGKNSNTVSAGDLGMSGNIAAIKRILNGEVASKRVPVSLKP